MTGLSGIVEASGGDFVDGGNHVSGDFADVDANDPIRNVEEILNQA